MSIQPQPVGEREIPAAMGRLDYVMNTLESMVSVLEERLTALLPPASPEDVSQGRACGATALGDRLLSACSRIEAVSSRINEMVDRVQI
jgi:hypothetical protein